MRYTRYFYRYMEDYLHTVNISRSEANDLLKKGGYIEVQSYTDTAEGGIVLVWSQERGCVGSPYPYSIWTELCLPREKEPAAESYELKCGEQTACYRTSEGALDAADHTAWFLFPPWEK